PPALVEVAATRPLEASLATVPGVRRLQSRTIRGAAELSVNFEPGTDMLLALQRCESQLSEVRAELPPDATLEVERVTPTALPILTFNVAGAADQRALHDLAMLVVRPALTRVEGVGRVDVLGGETREIEVLLRPAALAAAHLTPSAVADRLARESLVEAGGRVYEEHQVLTLVVDAQATTPADIAALPIATGPNGAVPLSAVADVREGAVDRAAIVTGPGGDVVTVTVARGLGASVPDVAQAAKAAVAELVRSGAVPAGVEVTPVYDQAELVDESIAGVRDAIVLGALLAMIVLGLSLRDVRSGVVAAVAVPVTLVATFGLMHLVGISLNLMSLGGLAVAIGLVVDDAIVIVEAIVHRMEEGEPPARAAATGTTDLFAAVVGTTLTTVIVFAPLGLLSGVVGTFFGSLAATLTIAVLLSLVVAVTLVPLMAARLLKARSGAGGSGPRRTRPRRHGDTEEHGGGGGERPEAAPRRRLSRAYGRLVERLVRRPLLGLLVVVLMGVGGYFALGATATGFLPAMDEGAFVLDFFLPAGTALEETDRVARRLDRILEDTPSVATFTRRTGAEMGPAAATEQNRGDIMVRLVPRDRRAGVDDVIDGVRRRVAAEVPEARVEFVQVLQDVLDDLAGNPRPIEVRFFGPDPAVLARVAHRAGELLDGAEGLEDLFDGVEGQVPELRAQVRRAAAANLGVGPRDVADDLAVAAEGRVVSEVRLPDRTVGVRVRFPDAVRFDPAALSASPLAYGPASVPLGAVVQWSRPRAPTELLRENMMPVVVLSADVSGADLGAAEASVRDRLGALDLPEGYRYEIGGQARSARDTQLQLAAVFGVGVVLVLAVLLIQLGTLRLAIVVLLGAPLALVGAVMTLAATGVPLNASSLMGCVLLAGLVVKNGILLLEHAQHEQQAGVPLGEALARGGARRLRPILMTTAATIAGLLPLAVSPGAGAEIQRPLAVATIGGLAISTVVTLFVVPSLAALLHRVGRRRPAPVSPAPPAASA
ncbi:MAG: efflux RND transporter permease subunit, partial [Myxococcales bacterium]|nr:efflux RND transporter permease subunit [Myxococcales bacterium]